MCECPSQTQKGYILFVTDVTTSPMASFPGTCSALMTIWRSIAIRSNNTRAAYSLLPEIVFPFEGYGNTCCWRSVSHAHPNTPTVTGSTRTTRLMRQRLTCRNANCSPVFNTIECMLTSTQNLKIFFPCESL